MLKVYGSSMCPDCMECKFNLDKNGIEYENIDITASTKNLKEFLILRDKDAAFVETKEKGYIGIPTLITDDGRITLDWESYLTERGLEVVHPGTEGTACGIDGKGC